jgi:hypothetical protein
MSVEAKRSKGRLAAVWIACALLGSLSAAAQEGETTVAGRIMDRAGLPAAGYRLLAQVADGTGVFVGEPADAEGRYTLVLPSGATYVFPAAVAPTGARIALPPSEPIDAAPGELKLDVYLPLTARPGPRELPRELGSSDRLFFGIAEEPSFVAGQRWEARADWADFDIVDRVETRVIGAISFDALPRVEIGGSGGFASLDPAGGGTSESGATDVDLWTKFHLLRSMDNRLDVALGALFTLPTGDSDVGLGHDSTQSELFASVGYSLSASMVIAHVGVRTSGDGEVAGIPIEGKVSASGGLGLVVPFSPRFSLLFEAIYDGERFEGASADSRVLAGVNWRLHPRGTLRGAISGGVESTSPDAEVLVGYAYEFGR